MRLNGLQILLWLLVWSVAQPVLAADWEISRIRFQGVHFEGEDEPQDLIQSQEGDDLDLRLVKLDKIYLSNYYRQNGFLDVEIRDSLQYRKKTKRVRLLYLVKEGRRYYYGGVRARGNSALTGEQILESFKEIKPQTPFNESLVSVAIQKVEDAYYNSGKPYVQIKANYLYEQDSLIYVGLDISEGETVYIRNIRYRGLKLVKKFLLRRELTFKKGERYDRSKMESSQKNLYGTGLFKYIRFELQPIDTLPGQTVLIIRVQENDPRWIGVHFGVAHEQESYYGNKFEITLQGGHRNLYGNARSFSLHVTPSFIYDFNEGKLHNPDNKIAFRFVEPWILNTRTPGIFNLAYEQYRPLNSGHFDLWRSTFDVSRSFGKYNKVTTTLSAKFVERINQSAIDSAYAELVQADQSTVYALTFYWKRDSRVNLFNPNNCSYTDFSLAFSSSSGKDGYGNSVANQYVVSNGSWQWYLPWRPKLRHFKRWHFTIAMRLKGGAIFEPTGTGIIPINDLFYAGGATTVRGYGEQLLGPAASVDSNGKITQAAGGKMMLINNLEIRIPLFWLFVGELFTDGGYVWPELSDFNASDYKFTCGAGLAVLSPLGPIRLDYGYKLNPSAQDAQRDSWHIGIYFAF